MEAGERNDQQNKQGCDPAIFPDIKQRFCNCDDKKEKRNDDQTEQKQFKRNGQEPEQE
jgi:hypothetical protein